MSFVVTPADRASFRRCRRQWDFGAAARQNLEPVRPPAAPDLDRALRDALAVYYYPGMWDWDRAVRLPVAVRGWSEPWTASGSGAAMTRTTGAGAQSWTPAGACWPATSSGRRRWTGSPRC